MADGTIVAIDIDGTRYELCYEDCTALDAKECRRQTGFSLREIFGAVADVAPDLDSVAAMVWLARRHDGEPNLRYDDVAAKITYGSEIVQATPVEATLPE